MGHLRRSRTIASALVDANVTSSALIVTGSPIAGRFDFPERVDHVRLPGVIKLPDGSYTSSSLAINIDHMTHLRGAIIEAAAREFAPDLLIVDKEPWGFRGELATTLDMLRAQGTRIILGLRDVLDDEDLLAAEWARKGAVDAIERFYDEIWVYGMPQICRPLDGMGLSARMRDRIFYTGYLRRAVPEWPAEPDGELPDQPYLLVTTGGGGDGRELVDWVLRAYEEDRGIDLPALIVYGPFMKAADRADFDARIARLDDRVTSMAFHARLERLLANAAGVVAMGGYNTFCEILSMGRPAIIAPRTRPRREQLIRARAAERLGLLRMLTPERDGHSALTMARAIREIDRQAPPSEARIPGLLSGLESIVERARGDMSNLVSVGG
ncbi:glycosyltransferase family protein [Thermohalobaculum xanthum]|uniref:glycosyltransferase family protein n=1 Tax=Thermohalobaculum xanthum TaxID=2753746 RepID=UPI002D7F1E1C|nr:glycosyltransferase [Thermohalobaculum xanthum]